MWVDHNSENRKRRECIIFFSPRRNKNAAVYIPRVIIIILPSLFIWGYRVVKRGHSFISGEFDPEDHSIWKSTSSITYGEIPTISQVNHKNVVKLLGEVAGALAYLHSSSSAPIYHWDIKSTNILLDDKYRAKVVDFGISRSVSIDQTHPTTGVVGNFGYMDLKYFRSSYFKALGAGQGQERRNFNGRRRPTIKEVAVESEGIPKLKKGSEFLQNESGECNSISFSEVDNFSSILRRMHFDRITTCIPDGEGDTLLLFLSLCFTVPDLSKQ
ncbi:hypothetical protein ACS0TY_034241 [Phlomoides rotata]